MCLILIEIVENKKAVDADDKVYIVFSATPYKMGRFIRFFTGGKYNHVSVSADYELTEMYSFARRYRCAPLMGGFVKESGERFYANGKCTRIMMCEIPVSKEKKAALISRFAEMKREREKYIYNFFSAAAVPMHRKIRVRDAYTCVEFAVAMLELVGWSLDGMGYIGLDELENQLEKFKVYEGDFPGGVKTDVYDDYEYAVSFAEHYRAFIGDMFTLTSRKMRLGRKG